MEDFRLRTDALIANAHATADEDLGGRNDG
jgi:hypothetical protein